MSDRVASWPKQIVEWTIGDTAYISVVFTWLLPAAYSLAVWYRQQGYKVRAGGTAVDLFPFYLTDIAELAGDVDALPRHNPDATYTSRGCIHNCRFCAVPIIEGDISEIPTFRPAPIVCDNNLLACSRRHFNNVVDVLMPLRDIDFNSGLDVRALRPYHIDRLRDLDLLIVRLAFDNIKTELALMRAVERLLAAGFPPSKLRCYVLINFEDTPDDALYRCEALRRIGVWPNVQRYQPISSDYALVKDSYVSDNWTDHQLKRFVRYWNRQSYFCKVPFSEFDNSMRRPRIKAVDAAALF